ncbi:biliverdin-producing heme oxygenase [Bradyrhizobium tropiciagri]|nr:biliverdin-producing heme oxygenase [Bradyrhizobium tropiciagri]
MPTPSHIVSNRFAGRPPSLRSVLKAATATDHAKLDAMLGAFDLCSLAGYRRFLEINAAALLPLEGALVAAGVRDLVPDWSRRARSRAMLADLAAIGGTVRPLDPPILIDRPAMLGTLYVLEGSRLGAAHLLKRIDRTAGPRIRTATAYLGHGAGQHLWPSFLALLESHASELSAEDDIIEPARRAFDLFASAARQP